MKLSVRPSVLPPDCCSSSVHAAGLLLWARWAGNIDRLFRDRRSAARRVAANAGSVALSADVGS